MSFVEVQVFFSSGRRKECSLDELWFGLSAFPLSLSASIKSPLLLLQVLLYVSVMYFVPVMLGSITQVMYW